jgi:peptide/nickel transport system substrate-binding protein
VRLSTRWLVVPIVVLGLMCSGIPEVAAQTQGGQIVIGLPWQPVVLNPVVESDGVSYLVNLWVFDSLIRIDRNLQPVPELAESWSASRDGKTWTLKLKRGVTWHDGKPFSAADVEFTLYSILNPRTKTARRDTLAALVGYAELTNAQAPKTPADLPQRPIEVVDPLTIRFHLSRPYAPFLVESLHLGILPKHLLDGKDLATDEFNSQPVGTGPFKFVSWRRGDRLTFEANPAYHGGRPHLDRVILRVIPDETVLLQELRNGGIDFMERVPREAVTGLQGMPTFKVEFADNVGWSNFVFNMKDPVVSQKAVRQAFAHAIDMRPFIKDVLFGLAKPATGPYPPGQWMYETDVKTYAPDPARARALLDEAGWRPGADGIRAKDGKPPVLRVSTFKGHQVGERLLVYAQEQLKAVGIGMQVEILELAAWLKSMSDGVYQVTMFNHDGSVDPDRYAYGVYHSAGGRNRARYVNEAVDKAVEDGRATTDQAVRKAAYSRFQKLIAEDIAYWPVYHYQHIYAYRAGFKGFVPSPVPSDVYRSVKGVWLEK